MRSGLLGFADTKQGNAPHVVEANSLLGRDCQPELFDLGITVDGLFVEVGAAQAFCAGEHRVE